MNTDKERQDAMSRKETDAAIPAEVASVEGRVGGEPIPVFRGDAPDGLAMEFFPITPGGSLSTLDILQKGSDPKKPFSPSRNAPPRVLLVDDDATARMLIRESMEQSGFKVAEAEDGVEALTVFQSFNPNLVLMDVLMPRLDGIEACAALRKMPGGESVPVVILTGLGDLNSIAHAYEVGATDFITKPIQWMILEQRLRYMLRASQTMDDLRRSRLSLTEAQRIARLGNWEWHIEENILLWSEESYRIHGMPLDKKSISFFELFERVHPRDRLLVLEAFEAAMAGGPSLNIDHRIVLPDGSERIVHKQAETSFDEEGRTIRMAGTVQDITERKRAEEEILYLAQHDSLTRLPNRHFLREHLRQVLARAERYGSLVALMFLDLDSFKRINDTLGHDRGDLLLQQVAERLVRCLRKEDSVTRAGEAGPQSTVARLGGDEFTVLLSDLHQAEDAGKVAQRILKTLTNPFQLGSQEVFVGASIGITLYPADGEDGDALLKSADTAMYYAKEQGGNNYQYYTQSMNEDAFSRLALENALRRALEREELLLHYQPQVEIGTGRIVAAEALLRWQHPEKGLLLPREFIGLAEETGLIVPIGEWVLRSACAACRRWQKESPAPLRVSVNLSQRQFRQEKLVDTVAAILQETGLDPSLLELELTEGIIMDQAEAGVDMLRRLKAMGILLSIDDFGTGHSSLSTLKRLPIDILKIDRSFIEEIPLNSDSMAITSAIIAMARSLKLKVIAEGVETVEQFDFLQANACGAMQGFFLSRPLSFRELMKLLNGDMPLDAEGKTREDG